MSTLLQAGVCGHFGGGKSFFDGQTVKTVILTESLRKIWGSDQVLTLDTYQWKKYAFRILIQSVRLLRKCENIFILPSWNGVRVFVPLFLFLNRFFHRRIHYVIIGSWLPDVLKESSRLLNKVKRLDGLYGETVSLTEELKALHIPNVYLLPNFKELQITEDVSYEFQGPFKLCVFSRVIKQKGICEAVEAVKKVNTRLGKIVYTLDIWGGIDHSFAEEFVKLRSAFPEYITYRGCLSYKDTTETLRQYFALLFPTRYPREGVPGSILDSYAAGLPVLSSHFINAPQIIEHGKTGLILDFEHITEALEETLLELAVHPEELIAMRQACVLKAADYQADKVVAKFVDMIDGKDNLP